MDIRARLLFDEVMDKSLPPSISAPVDSLPILVSPAPSLRQPSIALSFEAQSGQIAQWARLLGHALDVHPSGIGLAAPQVGWNIRMVAMELSGRKAPSRVWVNPVIKRLIGSRVSTEGCLSIPGKSFRCLRAKRLEIEAFDINGMRHSWRCDGLEALCWQHEIDHLDGRLIEDDDLRP